ncbi:UNVERIFIED_CONTAM: iron-containing alcohol dehydrogenase, partial [Bacillus subtilis]
GARGDWATDDIEHAVSAAYDVPDAGGLAITFPNWLGHTLSENTARMKQLAVRVSGVEEAGETGEEVELGGIEEMSEFLTSLGAPNRLAEYDIN